ncbi:uncharacterized protein BDV17DRAFT_288636 [Aspergillus undulatus]|uniref:uncharacterized protein n=1 Tax=Aspergillus undulatus TaxID=1810928 RepID=UPI003CCDCEC2
MLGCLPLVLLASSLSSPAVAQEHTSRIWALWAYTTNGESLPRVFPRPRALTSYGAYQAHQAGAAFRDRYVALNSGISEPGTRIENLSPYVLDNDDVDVAATPDAAVLASAQAFMQGIYPPLDESFNSSFFDNEFELADGSIVHTPLGGYQYPPIVTYGVEDPQSLALSGQALCPRHAAANIHYISSKEFLETYEESAAFYNRLHTLALSGDFDTTASNYANATSISEYLDYQAVHNESLLLSLSAEDVKRARWYAGKYVFATNGNTSAVEAGVDGSIRAIAGNGLASSVLNAFEATVQGRGAYGKMTLQFGTYKTAVSFASLLQLASSQNSNFYSLPNPGASFILELFSLETESYPTYPDPANLFVRFLLRNGTGTDFRPYPLFGHSPSNTAIPFSDFQAEMQRLSLGSTTDWCRRCNSTAVFCSGVLVADQLKASLVHKDRGGLSLAVAGVIGAAVTIGVITLAAAIAVFVSTRMKRRKPSLGGFKAKSKMASDSDLRLSKSQWDDDLKLPAAAVRRHERHGSWEMTDRSSPPGPSSFADEIEEDWQIHSSVEPAQTREHV